MKKLLTIAVATFAITAVNAYTAQQVGVTTIPTTSQNTIIPVPFTSLANSSEPVTAKDLVKTTGLAENTWLLYFDGAKYNAWRLNSSKVWEPGTYATIPGATVSQAANNLSVSAGGAMWIVLPDGETSASITVYGSYTDNNTSTVAAGKTMLVANPLQSDATIATSGAVKGDKITFIADGVPTVYTYNKAGKWVTLTDNGTGELIPTEISTIPFGAGFWCKASTNAITITWTPVAGS